MQDFSSSVKGQQALYAKWKEANPDDVGTAQCPYCGIVCLAKGLKIHQRSCAKYKAAMGSSYLSPTPSTAIVTPCVPVVHSLNTAHPPVSSGGPNDSINLIHTPTATVVPTATDPNSPNLEDQLLDTDIGEPPAAALDCVGPVEDASPCAKCSVMITYDCQALRCDACHRWWHLACGGRKRYPPAHRDWICPECAKKVY